MEKLTNIQREALIVLLTEKVDSLRWYAGQCFEDAGNEPDERFKQFTKDADFWFDILVKLEG